jgi:hypothetical protein
MVNVKKRVHDEATAIGQIYNEELEKVNLSKSALAIAVQLEKLLSKLFFCE